MHYRSNDRANPNERTEAPAVPELGASLLPPSGETPSTRLRTLVHDLANWYQRFEAQLERLEREHGVDSQHLTGLRAALQSCADLGAVALESDTALAPAVLPRALEEFVAQDEASRSPGSSALDLTSADEAATTLSISRASLENILLNLVNNARRACDSATPIRLSWSLSDGGGTLEVADGGAGMEAETLRHCTELGYSTQDGEGHGIGLAAVASQMEQTGGRLDIESEPGQGTRVRLHFGLAVQASENESPRRIPERVLLVEDDPDVGEVMRLFLEAEGVDAMVAPDGRTAWTLLGEFGPGLVVVDQGLPDLPGLSLAEGIRQQHPNLVLVLLTGDPGAARAQGGPGPVDAVGVKPLDRAGLYTLLENAVSHAERRHDQDSQRQKPAKA
jgi:CheY-like chemotaxis protein